MNSNNHPSFTMNNTQPALVRAFFAAFAAGVLSVDRERQSSADSAVQLTPQRVKQLMLEHYESISKHFFDIIYVPLASIHYERVEELTDLLQSPEIAPTLKTPADIFRYVCRTEEAHEDMVTEYRRNFACLLSGRVMSVKEFFDGFPAGYLQGAAEPCRHEVTLLTRVVMRAYYAGKETAGHREAAGTNQVDLFCLLLDALQCLLHAAPVALDEETDLNQAFLTVCRSEANLAAMLEAMRE